MRNGPQSTRAWRPAGIALLCAAVGGCTTSFDPNERPFRDGGRDDVTDVAPDDVRDDGPADAGDAADGGCETCPAGSVCCGGRCVDTVTDPAHCGRCGEGCPGTTCQGGACTSICRLGFLECDMNAATGCEVDSRTDPVNCGACGVRCTAGQPCVDGRCGCPEGFANCDNDPRNGCEIETATDEMHCGACGRACGTNQACAMGSCACTSGWADCDGDAANGCEANCGAGRACAAGACAPGWQPMAASPLEPRHGMFFALVPARHELLVWGGTDGAGRYFNNGARYNWDSDAWTPMAASPLSPRAHGTAVWTGTELFVWGGRDSASGLGSGALYNPETNAWRPVAMMRAPNPRAGFHAAWTGTEVLVYGGADVVGAVRNDGGLYNPASNNWRSIPNSVNTLRSAAAWTGSELLVWGGDASNGCATSVAVGTGRRYDPASNSWSSLGADANTPSARWFAADLSGCTSVAWQAPWTGTEMFVWGGTSGAGYETGGARYRRADNSWQPVAAPPAPLAAGAFLPVVVWTGREIVGWSASVESGASATATNVVFRYDPAMNAWMVTTPAGHPPPVHEGAAYGWTGHELIVWGGRTGPSTASGQGGRLTP